MNHRAGIHGLRDQLIIRFLNRDKNDEEMEKIKRKKKK